MRPTSCLLLVATVRLAIQAEDFDLPSIVHTVSAYQLSMETLRLRTESNIIPSPEFRDLQEQDRTAWGPRALITEEYGEAPGERRYFRRLVERDAQLISSSDDYKDGDIAYSLTRSSLDPKQVLEFYIRRNYRFEKSGLGAPPEILMGLISVDGRPLYKVLSDPSTELLGSKPIDGTNCYEIRASNRAGTSRSVVYHLDPSHDLLTRNLQEYSSTGQLIGQWRTTKFTRVGKRWFPQTVIRDVVQLVAGQSKVVSQFHTNLAEVGVNEPLDAQLFRPVAPEGALVTDETKETPVTYIKGGQEAAERLGARLAALKKAQTTPDAGGESIIVPEPRRWSVYVGSVVAIASGLLLLLAGWIRARK